MSLILAAVLALSSPAGASSSTPFLATTRSGALMMSWLEATESEGHALKFAIFEKGRWSAPRVIAERTDFVVNWADFPSIVEDARGTLFAHWLQNSGSNAFAYDAWITASSDGGKTWAKPQRINRDGKAAEHGFVSIVARAKEGVELVWLDGRAMAEGGEGGAMSLRHLAVDASLKMSEESVLDARTCECCATSMAMTGRGPLVAYRDRSEQEVRDIAVVRRTARGWSEPAIVHADGWTIKGCPVNGPQIDARGDAVAVAWFTAADDRPQVQAAFSNDGGATFGKPVRIDGGDAPAGRVDVVLLADGSAVVSWIEGTGILVRRVWPNGRLGAPSKLATTTAARAAGFPRAAALGDAAYLAWTDPAEQRVHVSRIPAN